MLTIVCLIIYQIKELLFKTFISPLSSDRIEKKKKIDVHYVIPIKLKFVWEVCYIRGK